MPPSDLLRIVHVVRQFNPAVGGMENFVEQLAVQQISRGHQVTVVTLDRQFDDPGAGRLPGHDLHRGIRIRRVPFRGSRRYPLAPRAIVAIRGADIIHVHGVDFFSDFFAATAALHRKPMILSTHGGFFHTGFARTLKRMYFRTVSRAAMTRFAAVIACSEQDERLFKEICSPRLRLISNPVDVAKFAGLARRGGRRLIYFGRIAPNKEMPTLISWFAGLAAHHKAWTLTIAGRPSGVSFAELRALAEVRGVGDRIRFHDTPSDSELSKLIAEASAYVCASSYEGFGLAAIEAASAGLYPVLSTIAPFRHSLHMLGYGMTVDFSGSQGWEVGYRKLADAIDRFAGEADGQVVADRVAPFAWPEAAEKFEAVYNDVLGRGRRLIGSIPVDVISRAAATARIVSAARDATPLLVAFCNAHTVNLAARDARLRGALDTALVLNDGVGVDLASRAIFGGPFPDNLNGTDLIPELLASAAPPLRPFLLGAAPGVAEMAARAIERNFPGTHVAGMRDGFFEDDDSEGLIADVIGSGANLLLVAMGQPRQEIWAATHAGKFDGPTICVGALFDFMAGRVPRASPLIRKLRLEWMYRLWIEPTRLWRRYLLGNIAFVARVLRQRVRHIRL